MTPRVPTVREIEEELLMLLASDGYAFPPGSDARRLVHALAENTHAALVERIAALAQLLHPESSA